MEKITTIQNTSEISACYLNFSRILFPNLYNSFYFFHRPTDQFAYLYIIWAPTFSKEWFVVDQLLRLIMFSSSPILLLPASCWWLLSPILLSIFMVPDTFTIVLLLRKMRKYTSGSRFVVGGGKRMMVLLSPIFSWLFRCLFVKFFLLRSLQRQFYF